MEGFIYYVLIFFIYSFIGWAQEVVQTIVKEQKFVNRGFFIGPLCPIYGFGSMMITYFLKDDIKQPFYIFLTAVFICCILEYLTSYILEKIFKARWWDYSDKPFNLNGRVCLLFSLAFGLGALLILYGINPYIIDPIYKNVPFNVLMYTNLFLLVLFLIDVSVSFKVIGKIKNISNSVRSDNTEQITKEVKKILAKSTAPYRRLLESFPDMKINNKMSIIKERFKKHKKKYLAYKKSSKDKYKQAKLKMRLLRSKKRI